MRNFLYVSFLIGLSLSSYPFTATAQDDAVCEIPVELGLPLELAAGQPLELTSIGKFGNSPLRFKTHEGIDIATPVNTPVLSILDGEVTRVLLESDTKNKTGWGNLVVIKHKHTATDGTISILHSLYAHLELNSAKSIKKRWLDAKKAKEKLELTRGEKFASSGVSGCTSCLDEPHLHLEVMLNCTKNVLGLTECDYSKKNAKPCLQPPAVYRLVDGSLGPVGVLEGGSESSVQVCVETEVPPLESAVLIFHANQIPFSEMIINGPGCYNSPDKFLIPNDFEGGAVPIEVSLVQGEQESQRLSGEVKYEFSTSAAFFRTDWRIDFTRKIVRTDIGRTISWSGTGILSQDANASQVQFTESNSLTGESKTCQWQGRFNVFFRFQHPHTESNNSQYWRFLLEMPRCLNVERFRPAYRLLDTEDPQLSLREVIGSEDLQPCFKTTSLVFGDGNLSEIIFSTELVCGSPLGFTNESVRLTRVSGLLSVDLPKENSSVSLPIEFGLSQNYPNPFNPMTQINFTLSKAINARLEVYNIVGQLIATLVDRPLEAGNHSISWDGSQVASGVYIYRLSADDFVDTKKMVLLK